MLASKNRDEGDDENQLARFRSPEFKRDDHPVECFSFWFNFGVSIHSKQVGIPTKARGVFYFLWVTQFVMIFMLSKFVLQFCIQAFAYLGPMLFWVIFPSGLSSQSVWVTLCGSNCMGYIVWVILCGSHCMGHIVQAILCGSQSVDHIKLVSLFELHCVGHILWVTLCGSHFVGHIVMVTI